MKTKHYLLFFLATLLFHSSFAQRKVLVEQFTNSGCPPCAANTPVVASYVNSHTDSVIMLAYHTSFPYFDSMYYENPIQSAQRVSYYGIGGVPYSVVDGNYFTGNLVPSIASTISNRASISPRYTITFSSSQLNNSMLHIEVYFQSSDGLNQNENLTAMVAVAEKNVLKSSYVCCAGANSETVYPWVVRRLLPDHNGTTLVNTQLNGIDLVSLNWPLANIKDLNQLRIVAFVQNTVTKEIYQSEISTPTLATGIYKALNKSTRLFDVFPTIASDHLTIQMLKWSADARLKVINAIGESVYAATPQNTNIEVATSGLADGIYFVQVNNGSQVETKKIIISNNKK